jgi:tRNA A37 threonylcarbamoyladenosine dehydratase
MTLHSNVGQNKVDVWESRIKDINPNIEVIKIKEFINKDNIDIIFNNKIDYLVDACDTIETKKELIRKCSKNNIKIISSMGMGNKLDPSQIEITDIRKTSYDPIAKIIRKMIKDEKISTKIPVVYSKEQPIKTNNKIISSNSFVPATAGLLCTSYIINDIIK